MEISDVGIIFKILGTGEIPPPVYKKSSGHMIYTVKMDFISKYPWVKYVHRTPDPESSSYAGVV